MTFFEWYRNLWPNSSTAAGTRVLCWECGYTYLHGTAHSCPTSHAESPRFVVNALGQIIIDPETGRALTH